MPSWLPIPGLLDLLDIALVAGLAWLAIQSVRQTPARPALLGLGLLVAVYAVARGLGLKLVATLFQGFFAVVVIVLIVVFQEELRRLFERLGTWRTGPQRPVSGQSTVLDTLVRSVGRLATTRTGALIVLPGREPLDRHVDGGVVMNGRLSEPLLLSLFDASSPGHDGAVVVRGGSIERFAAHLPLSANHEVLGAGGTRHAAALGLSEHCDATCIAVSEERGTISLARDGELRVLSGPEELLGELRKTLAPPTPTTGFDFGGPAARDAALALVASIALWMVFVPGSDRMERSFPVPVEITNLPSDQSLESIEPETVMVRLEGLRRDLLLVEPDDVVVRVDGYLARLGRRTFTLGVGDVVAPDSVSAIELEPDRVRISLQPLSRMDVAPE